ncbi:hypothetical protein CO178_00490 [candidate division WWE3 bacterium CG_4_9_14_3_um_filter_34_6]|uniref:Uncharacterized protein n=1 Tax=candidate division WWE3 bacterium CG_4_9_14_3_um_filter_34_6 TaxID=1975079 RepID=A0A2M7X562_UNCKA|nr:MAG: hypothetical protein CO178_00490 [candidate division WWE3 bacterium CG_4_9_14_3_um_filter_34_6]
MEKEITKLERQLKITNRLLHKFTSLKWAFYRGVLSGLGGIIGATLVLTFTVWILSRLEFVPIVGHFVTQITNFVVTNSVIHDPRIPN